LTPRRILVAGIGNIFLGDDAFGVEVVRRLAQRPLPECVRVIDFGIRGFDLAYELVAGYELAILVDAAPRGAPPGTLHVIEPDLSDLDSIEATTAGAHGLVPVQAIRLAAQLDSRLPTLRLVGCEPAPLMAEEGHMGLSDAVQAAVQEATRLVEAIVLERLQTPHEVG
jgi:hydrogenase maturation protease